MNIEKPWLCPSPNVGLSIALRQNDYDAFVSSLSLQLNMMGTEELESLYVKCEGQCPKGCSYKLKLGKSISKSKFNKLYKHGAKYPEHCIIIKYDGIIRHKVETLDLDK